MNAHTSSDETSPDGPSPVGPSPGGSSAPGGSSPGGSASCRLAILDGVATITIDDPATRNALSASVLTRLAECCELVDNDDAVRVVVVRGGPGRVFVSGGNISEVNRAVGGEHNSPGAAAMMALLAVHKPVIAAINGHCLGGGLMLALSADLRIAVEDATFGIPAVRLGVAYPQAGVDLLVREIGAARARELLITGNRIDATTAAMFGLVSQSVPADNFDAAIDALVATLLTNAPLSMTASKLSVRAADQPEQSGVAAASIAGAWESNDAKEGTAAFLEKRSADFTAT